MQKIRNEVVGLGAAVFVSLLSACTDRPDTPPVTAPIPADSDAIYTVANGCFAIGIGQGRFLQETASGYTFSASDADTGSRFRLRPADLGQYLLFDARSAYLTSDGTSLLRQSVLSRDISEVDGNVVVDDSHQSEGVWALEAVPDNRFLLQHKQSGAYLTDSGLSQAEADATAVELVAQDACAEFPELTLNASGDIRKTEFDDGSVFGFVETHSHLFTNFGFGGGGVFHGSPYHPLGVQHALPDCDLNHGEEGRKDFLGATFNAGIGSFTSLLPAITFGQLPAKDHDTQGYPEFTSWPNAPGSATHQVQYYKWIERAYLSGLRLLVQHATTNQVLCQLVTGIGANPKRYDCNDMVAVDHIIDATYGLERYIDALSGGPGKGWFRIVSSPAEARDEIKAGNLAVVLGIETSDLFDCFLVPFGDFTRCTKEDVVAKLDQYYARGVRVLFPVHKFDNAFSAGDGDRRVSDIGNFAHTGHFSNFIQCPHDLLTFPGGFDTGGVNFSNLNRPRVEFDSAPPFDMAEFDTNPIGTLLPNIGLLGGEKLEGEYCQNHGLTELGEFLILEMMRRGMVIEVDHLPRKSYQRAFEMLVENDYPAVGSHGRNNNGLIYELGGMSKFNFKRCRDAESPGTMDDNLENRVAMMRELGVFASEGFGFDLNGFAGAPGPRFGPRATCTDPQTDEGITYPFKSYAGDITLEQPVVGNRTLDFNTEGMVHLGLVAELIEDARRDGVSDEALEPLFKSAEGYIRLWEKSEARAVEIENTIAFSP